MYKKFINNTLFTAVLLTGLVGISVLLTSCEDDDAGQGPITISKLYLQDANSVVPDREVTFVRLGQLLRIEGTGFKGLRKVYINGFSTYFNPVFVSDVSMLVTVSSETPLVDADPAVRNTIELANDKNSTIIDFEIRAATPSITSISNTLPLAQETITVEGSGLTEISRVVFPGDIEVTTGIVSDEDGEFFTVVVPDGISANGGSLFVEGSNGGCYSPAYFNCQNGVILNFDGAGAQGFWGSATGMIFDNDLESAAIGSGNVSQGVYVPHRPPRIASFAPATVRDSEVWTAGNGVDNWRGQLTPLIPATTPLDQIAFQLDVFVPEEWQGSGYLKFCLDNSFSGGEWARASYNWVPWIVDGEVEPFVTTGWTTVTIPLDRFYQFSEGDFTFEDVLAYREAATFKNFGIYFENNDFTLENVTGNSADGEVEFPSAATNVEVYTDNWRIVSLETPVFSDFPEE